MFGSRKNYPATRPSPAGKKIVDELGWVVDKKTSERYIGKIGEKDIYTPKQEALPSVYLKTNLERFNAGAMSLDQYKQFIDATREARPYSDLTRLPSTLAEVQQILIDADETFYSLPVELRADFGHSKERFLAAMSDGSASEVFQKFKERKNPAPVKKEEKNES